MAYIQKIEAARDALAAEDFVAERQRIEALQVRVKELEDVPPGPTLSSAPAVIEASGKDRYQGTHP